jgi:hypothetical protein
MSQTKEQTPPIEPSREPEKPMMKFTAYRLTANPMKILPSPADRRWMDSNRNGANRCLPLRMANQAGWLILNDTEFEVTWTGNPLPEGLEISYQENNKPRFVSSLFGFGILTFHIPYLFRTPPGYNLLARGPANWLKDGVILLEGLVETDWAVASFTMNWKFTTPGLKVPFRKNEPICMVVPQRRGELEAFEPEIRDIASAPDLERGHKTWSDSRFAFMAEKKQFIQEKLQGLHPEKEAPWQPDYTLGRAPGGEESSEHQIKLQLKPFSAAPE